MQGATDCLLLNVECRMHEGVHIWLDTCIAEILPAAELDERRLAPDLNPRLSSSMRRNPAPEGNWW